MRLSAVFTAVAAASLGLLTTGCTTPQATAPSTFTPGTYTAKVTGHNAPMTVKVTVSKNRIESIDTSDNLETIGVGKVALEIMKDKDP